jgi:signal transduction histidine kinase
MAPEKKPSAPPCPEEFRRTCPLIREARRRQRILLQRQRAFLSLEAHELRAHLHGLMGYAGLVRRKARGCLPAQQEENLNKILRCAEELRGAIDRLDEFPFAEEED